MLHRLKLLEKNGADSVKCTKIHALYSDSDYWNVNWLSNICKKNDNTRLHNILNQEGIPPSNYKNIRLKPWKSDQDEDDSLTREM